MTGVLYFLGLGLIVAETVLPGLTMGVIGFAALVVSVIFGFRHHWLIGTAQIGLAAVVTPLCLMAAMRRLTLRTAVEGESFARNYEGYLGKEGQTQTDLRPAGIVLIDGRKVDVVTAGESIEKGSRVRVSRVEGNRIVVRAV
jgi:membrane-bound serine protease (ClpP class)